MMKPHPREMSNRTLETWDSWIDEAIRDARERGDFDNLPGQGQPLNLERNPFAGDREVAFHALKNADMRPYWMELDRDVTKALQDLDAVLAQSAGRIARLRRRACAQSRPGAPARSAGKVLSWLRGDDAFFTRGSDLVDTESAERERQYTRRQYLDRAAAVDKMIREYNAALPEEIRWLERPRLLTDQAAAQFDARCPAIICEATAGDQDPG